ncbi:MAG: porin [Gemmatimonadales bacterium]
MRRTLILSAFCLSVLIPGAVFGQSQPSIKYETDDVTLTFHGRLQLEGWSSSCSGFVPGLPENDPDSACDEGAPPFDIFLRRARTSIEAGLFDFLDVKLQLDFSGFDDVAIKDGYARLNFFPALKVRFGNMKRPFDGFQLTSSSQMIIIERDLDIPGVPSLRALSLDELTTRFRASDRDVGIELSGDVAGGRVSYWVGYFGGQQIQEALDTLPNADSRGQWIGRVQANLEVGKLPLDVAVAGAVTDRPFVTDDGVTFTGKYFTNLELWLQLGGFNEGPLLQGEYVYGQNPFETRQGDILDFPPTDEFEKRIKEDAAIGSLGRVALDPLVGGSAADAVSFTEFGDREVTARPLDDQLLAFSHRVGLQPRHRRLLCGGPA